jgi:serine protease AprX
MRRAPRAGLLGLLILALSQIALGGPPVVLGSGQQPGHVDRPLRRAVQQSPMDVIPVIVQARRLSDAEQAVQRIAGRTRARLPHVAGLSAAVRADQVDALSRQSGVIRVMLDPMMNPVGWDGPNDLPPSVFAQTVGAQSLWQSGQMGQGVAIAVLDSGVQAHRDFGSRIVRSDRFNDAASNTSDQLGHGTWVAGIAAGDGSSSNGRYTGVASRRSST